MSKKLTLVEAVALGKLAKKREDECKKAGEKLEPGNYTYDATVKIDGSLSRGADTEVRASHKPFDTILTSLELYCSDIGGEEGKELLHQLMSPDGVAGAVQKLGVEAARSRISPEFRALSDEHQRGLKAQHDQIAAKTPRAGNTSVVGAIEKVPNYQGDLAER